MQARKPDPIVLFTALCLLAAIAPAQAQTGRGASVEPRRPESETTRPGVAVLPLDLAADALTERVAGELAAYFGLPREAIEADLRFERDLGADPVDAAEIVGRICSLFRVSPPARGEAVSLATLVAHIERARERRGTEIQGTGGEPEREFAVREVYYATTRAVGDGGDLDAFYGGARAAAPRGMEYGRCEVTIPVVAHQPGQLESPRLWKFEFAPDPRKHVVLRSISPLPGDGFWRAVGGEIAAGGDGGDEILVFVHGFNVGFAKSVRRTAQIAYDLGFGGTPLVFSWPSDGSLMGYISDREDAEWSVPYLVELLETLRARSGARRIHLLAHSMGNQVLIRALFRLSLLQGDDAPRFDNVILAAPDFDARVFTEEIAPRVAPLADRWTLYASDKDTALDASRVLSARRLGTPLALAPGIDCVDATGVEVTPWSAPEFHSYYASKLKVLADLAGVLRGLEPGLRDLLPRERGGLRYWALSTVP